MLAPARSGPATPLARSRTGLAARRVSRSVSRPKTREEPRNKLWAGRTGYHLLCWRRLVVSSPAHGKPHPDAVGSTEPRPLGEFAHPRPALGVKSGFFS